MPGILGETPCAVKLIIKLHLLVMQEFAVMKSGQSGLGKGILALLKWIIEI